MVDGLNEACDGDGDGARAKSRDCPFSSTLPTVGGTSLSCCLQLRYLGEEVEVGSCLATFPPPAHHPFDIPSVSSQSPPT